MEDRSPGTEDERRARRGRRRPPEDGPAESPERTSAHAEPTAGDPRGEELPRAREERAESPEQPQESTSPRGEGAAPQSTGTPAATPIEAHPPRAAPEASASETAPTRRPAGEPPAAPPARETAPGERTAARADRTAEPDRGPQRGSLVSRTIQVVDYLFYLLYGLLAMRFLLTLIGARESAGFVGFIHDLTNPFLRPFSGIVSQPPANGGVVDMPIVVAFFAYIVLHLAVRGLLRLFLPDRKSATTR